MKWVRADMGFEPGVSGWEARTLSLCIVAPLFTEKMHRSAAKISHLLVQWIFIVRHSMNQHFRWICLPRRIWSGDLQFKSTDPQPPELQHQLTSVNDEFHGRHLFIAATKDWRHRRSWTINLDAKFYFCLSDKQFFAHSRKHEARCLKVLLCCYQRQNIHGNSDQSKLAFEFIENMSKIVKDWPNKVYRHNLVAIVS